MDKAALAQEVANLKSELIFSVGPRLDDLAFTVYLHSVTLSILATGFLIMQIIKWRRSAK